MEIKSKVETYKIDCQCDDCKLGVMIQTGYSWHGAYSTYEHKCDKCENVKNLLEKYPKFEYINSNEEQLIIE